MTDKPTVKTSKKVSDPNAPKEKPIFDQIYTTQQAINMAIAEYRVVRYKTEQTNQEIKNQIDNKKGCLLRKPDKDSSEVAIIPPGIEDFTFDKNVDESLVLTQEKARIWLP